MIDVRMLRNDPDALREALEKRGETAEVDRLVALDVEHRRLLAESERLRKAGADEFGAADFFAAAFEPGPKLRDSCADPRRHRFVEQLLETPEYRVLHADAGLAL